MQHPNFIDATCAISDLISASLECDFMCLFCYPPKLWITLLKNTYRHRKKPELMWASIKHAIKTQKTSLKINPLKIMGNVCEKTPNFFLLFFRLFLCITPNKNTTHYACFMALHKRASHKLFDYTINNQNKSQEVYQGWLVKK